MDTRNVAQHVGLDPETVVGRLQALVDFLGSQRVRRINMRQSRDGDILEEHRNSAMASGEGRQSSCWPLLPHLYN